MKIDFPRVPYPKNAAQFRKLAKLGGKLRALHLLSPAPPRITTYPADGDHFIDGGVLRAAWKITDAKKRVGNVRINAAQFFGGVPESAWTKQIGGYLPAQKYLKDRKGRRLSPAEISHYQNLLAALAGMEGVVGEIEKAAVW